MLFLHFAANVAGDGQGRSEAAIGWLDQAFGQSRSFDLSPSFVSADDGCDNPSRDQKQQQAQHEARELVPNTVFHVHRIE